MLAYAGAKGSEKSYLNIKVVTDKSPKHKQLSVVAKQSLGF